MKPGLKRGRGAGLGVAVILTAATWVRGEVVHDSWWIDVQPLDIETTGDGFWSIGSVSIAPIGHPPRVRDGWRAHDNNDYGLWGLTLWFRINGGQERTTVVHDRGKAKAKGCGPVSGLHTVTGVECGLSAPTHCP